VTLSILTFASAAIRLLRHPTANITALWPTSRRESAAAMTPTVGSSCMSADHGRNRYRGPSGNVYSSFVGSYGGRANKQ
jgi:hypothetical protein